MPHTILLVDDEKLVRWSLRERLARERHRIVEAENGAKAREAFREGVDLAILDYRLPDTDGLALMNEFKKTDPDVPIIMITAHASVENAVEAMRLGAFEYTTKPFNLEELAVKVEKALETRMLRKQVREVQKERHSLYGFDSFVGKSARIRDVIRMARTVSASPATTILIQGESGTGKDLMAKAIHYESHRAARPFMNITCSALSETLLEGELFGHEKGAFTDAKDRKKGLLEQADGGTIFLDEIGDTSLALQAKLLRFLEEKAFKRVGGTEDISVDVRIVAATNRDLARDVKEKKFREDLFYRLRVVPLLMPPLRERPEDIALLADFFRERFAREFRKPVSRIAPEAMTRLKGYGWPGNIRELRNVVERAMLVADGEAIEERHLLLEGQILDGVTVEGAWQLPPAGIDIDQLERHLVEQALARSHWNQTRAAKLLGLNRDQIRYRIEKFSLTRPPG